MDRWAKGRNPLLTALVALGLVTGCQVTLPFSAPVFTVDVTPAAMYRPEVFDWALHRVSGARLATNRQAHFKTLAFPAVSTGWNVGATPGLPLTSYGCLGTDFVPNGPAAAYTTVPTSPLYNKLFFLTKLGKLIKVDRTNPASYVRWDAPGGKTFSRTFVTMSPKGARAYLLSDDGVLYVVNTLTMATVAVLPVGGGGYGIAPWIDPYASRHDDTTERLYVASNNGAVHQFDVFGGSDGSVSSVGATTTHNVATGAVPMYGLTRKITAPPVVLGGVIYVGDTGGDFHVYDTNNAANSLTFALGAPISAAPAIEIQDGTYTLTDPLGNPKTVAIGQPTFAFVSAGASCAWINLHDTTVTRSQSLRIDDNDNRRFGNLLDYNYSAGTSTEFLAAVDGGNINTESPDRALPNYAPNNWSNDFLVPAETNTYQAPVGTAQGGPVYSYVRWQSAVAHPAGSVVTQATLSMRPVDFIQPCGVPEIRTTSPYYQLSTTPWASNGLTNVNRPAVGAANIGTFLSGAVNGAGNAFFFGFANSSWDVSAAISSPAGDGRYALALVHSTAGSTVFWPWGPVAGGTGFFAGNSATPEAVRFRNNPLNANPAPGAAGDQRPLLRLSVAAAAMPSATIESPPVIDALTKKVYVFYTNALYEMSFASPGAFADTIAGQKHTKFNLAWHGVPANNAVGVGGRRPGGAYNNRSRFVGNFTAPVPALDLSALFVLSRSPSPDGAAPTTWNYALSKLALPLNAAADVMAANSPRVTGLAGQAVPTGLAADREASAYMVIDPFPGTENVYFGLSNGRVYQYDR